jgi:hypothetical protein
MVSSRTISASRTVTQRPVSSAILCATFRAASSSASSSMMTLPRPEKAVGFDTWTMVGGDFWLTVDPAAQTTKPTLPACRFFNVGAISCEGIDYLGGEVFRSLSAREPTASVASSRPVRKVYARRIEAGCFKSWTCPDRKIPGYRVRKPWQPRRIFYRGWRRRHSGSPIHRAEPPAAFVMVLCPRPPESDRRTHYRRCRELSH